MGLRMSTARQLMGGEADETDGQDDDDPVHQDRVFEGRFCGIRDGLFGGYRHVNPQQCKQSHSPEGGGSSDRVLQGENRRRAGVPAGRQ